MPDRIPRKDDLIDKDNKESEPQDTADQSKLSNDSRPQQDHNTFNDSIATLNQSLDLPTQHSLAQMADCESCSTTLSIALRITATEVGNEVLWQDLAKSERVTAAMRA